MIGEVAQVVETVKPGAMSVAEIKTDRVIADLFPAEDLHAAEVRTVAPPMELSQDVTLALLW